MSALMGKYSSYSPSPWGFSWGGRIATSLCDRWAGPASCEAGLEGRNHDCGADRDGLACDAAPVMPIAAIRLSRGSTQLVIFSQALVLNWMDLP